MLRAALGRIGVRFVTWPKLTAGGKSGTLRSALRDVAAPSLPLYGEDRPPFVKAILLVMHQRIYACRGNVRVRRQVLGC